MIRFILYLSIHLPDTRSTFQSQRVVFIDDAALQGELLVNLSLPLRHQNSNHHPCDSISFMLNAFSTEAQVSQSASSTLLYLASNGLRVAVERSMS